MAKRKICQAMAGRGGAGTRNVHDRTDRMWK